jgi:hypothetical protein
MLNSQAWLESHSQSSCVLVCAAVCRSVILMESNLGMTELSDLITRLGDRSKVR